jgi:hypothetical protein
VRRAAAAALAVVALGSAIYFGSLRLETHGDYPACQRRFQTAFGNCGPDSRGFWQFLLAIVIAALGLAAAIRVLEPTDREPIQRAAAGALRVLAVGLLVGLVGLVIGLIVGAATAPAPDPNDIVDNHSLWIAVSAVIGGGIGFAAGCLARVAWLLWQSVRSRALGRDAGADVG